jgi:hypothetical protein
VSEACIRIIDNNLERPSLREVTGVTVPKRSDPDEDFIGDDDEIRKPTKKIKTE